MSANGTKESGQIVSCLVCGEPLSFRPSTGRKSGKPFIMLICGKDGRHFRGFITDQNYVAGVMARLEGHLETGSTCDPFLENKTSGRPA